MPDIGPIDTDYRSPKITDDLIQIGSALTATNIANLNSQIWARGVSTMSDAANTASLISTRAGDLAISQAKSNNLINMNLQANQRAWAEDAREQAKLPYVLDGMEARNWIDQTVARGNELKNELSGLTLMDRVEQERIDVELGYQNLQSNRMKNEADRREADSYNRFLPDYENFWSGVANGTIDPDTASRPFFGGKSRLNDLHQQRINSWRDSSTGSAAQTQASEDARTRSLERREMTPEQRDAVDDPTLTPQQRSGIRQQALETQRAKVRLRVVNPGASEGVIRDIENNIDPDTGIAGGTPHPTTGVVTPNMRDANGNLTPAGKQKMAKKMQELEAAKKEQALAPSTMSSTGRDVLDFRNKARSAGVTVDVDQVDTNRDGVPDEWQITNPAQVQQAIQAISAQRLATSAPTANSKATYVSKMTSDLMNLVHPTAKDANGQPRNYSPAEAAAEAENMWNSHFPRTTGGGPSAGGAAATAATVAASTPSYSLPTSPHGQSIDAIIRANIVANSQDGGNRNTSHLKELNDQSVGNPGMREELDTVERAIAKLHALDKLIRNKQPGESKDYSDRTGQQDGYEWHKQEYGWVAADEGEGKGPDLDFEDFDDRDAGDNDAFNGYAQWSRLYSSEDSSAEAIADFRSDIRRVIPDPSIFRALKPHPSALRAFEIQLPDLHGKSGNALVWGYIDNEAIPPAKRWIKIPAKDLKGGANWTVKDQHDWVTRIFRNNFDADKQKKFLIEGVDFERGTGRPIKAQGGAKDSMTWADYSKKVLKHP